MHLNVEVDKALKAKASERFSVLRVIKMVDILAEK